MSMFNFTSLSITLSSNQLGELKRVCDELVQVEKNSTYALPVEIKSIIKKVRQAKINYEQAEKAQQLLNFEESHDKII